MAGSSDVPDDVLDFIETHRKTPPEGHVVASEKSSPMLIPDVATWKLDPEGVPFAMLFVDPKSKDVSVSFKYNSTSFGKGLNSHMLSWEFYGGGQMINLAQKQILFNKLKRWPAMENIPKSSNGWNFTLINCFLEPIDENPGLLKIALSSEPKPIAWKKVFNQFTVTDKRSDTSQMIKVKLKLPSIIHSGEFDQAYYIVKLK